MAKTLLNGINEVLKRVSVIGGDANALTSLIDPARQPSVDIAVQVINEGIDSLYAASPVPHPNEQKEGTITLVDGTRFYALAVDLVQLRWPFIDKTNTQWLYEYPGGYNAMLQGDPEQDDTGLPVYGAIRATDGKLHLDRTPTSIEAGRIYTYQYDRDLVLTAAGDVMPFSDAVFRSMVPVWVQLWKRERQNQFDGDLFRISIGQAVGFLTQRQPRAHYSPR